MIIANSQLDFAASQHKETTERRHETLEVETTARGGSNTRTRQVASDDQTDLSAQALDLARNIAADGGAIRVVEVERAEQLQGANLRQAMSDRGAGGPVLNSNPDNRFFPGNAPMLLRPMNPPPVPKTDGLDPNLRLAAAILESLTGKPIRYGDGQSIGTALKSSESIPVSSPIDGAPSTGMGMRYTERISVTERETSTYAARGEIHTADGKTINIDLMMEMHHSYSYEKTTTIEAGVQLMDPLIINFHGPAADLSNEKYAFDLDSDGDMEHISFASSGSGFLMLDKNGDGRANNGNELFGASSGDGFGDLSIYDKDQNGFIDEADPIFSELKIWVKNRDGSDSYLNLQDKGIGAIYLGAVQTPFEIKDDQNDLQGVVRSSSFFLREDGSAGTVQQVDLVV